jgi:membrane-associated PAP2 superfamily phosphatase
MVLPTSVMSDPGLVDKTDDVSSHFDFDQTQEQTPSRFHRNQVKQLVLFLLVVQNVATILSMKQASGIRARDGRQALTTSIVVMVEVVKVAFCISEILVRCAPLACPIPADFLQILFA